MDRLKYLVDNTRTVDDASIFEGKKAGDTEIIFHELNTGKPFGSGRCLGKTHNRVVIAGSQFTAMKHFDLPELIALPTYNQDLSLDNSKSHGTVPTNIPKICLFACGTGGCGVENSQVYQEKYTSRIDPATELIPFRYQLPVNDLSSELRKKYFGRKSTSERIAYYFKAFESDPEMFARFVDGTIIDDTVYDSVNTSDAEFYVEMNLRVTKDDFRDYFRATTGIQDARVNSISLLSAWYSESDGYKWYQDIIPMTMLNIPNEPLIDLTKGIDIVYHIYY